MSKVSFDLDAIKCSIEDYKSKCAFMAHALIAIKEPSDDDRRGAMIIMEDLQAGLENLYDDVDSIDKLMRKSTL